MLSTIFGNTVPKKSRLLPNSYCRCRKAVSQSPHSSGFTLLETIITLGVLSIVMTTIFMMFNLYLESFDQELEQVSLERDAINALESMKEDLRDANAVDVSGCYLVNFTKASDSTAYSYYLRSSTQLMRVTGSTCSDGEMLSDFIDSANTSVTYANGLVRITLAFSNGDSSLTLVSSIFPRNI